MSVVLLLAVACPCFSTASLPLQHPVVLACSPHVLAPSVLLQIGPGLELAVQDSEKALQEAIESSGSLQELKAATKQAASKVCKNAQKREEVRHLCTCFCHNLCTFAVIEHNVCAHFV